MPHYSNNRYVITIDHREHAEILRKTLKETYHLTIQTEQLKIGDYKIFPDTVVERKTVNDFCLSIIDSRLFKQAYRLAQFAQNPILLVEGQTFSSRKHKISIEAVKGAFITLGQTFHIPILRSRDEEESAWYINCLLQQRRRVGRQSGVLSSSRPKRLNSQKQHLLRSLPGIGPKLAEQLLDQFGTVENIARAQKGELNKISGLGKKKIDSIYRVLHEDDIPYQV